MEVACKAILGNLYIRRAYRLYIMQKLTYVLYIYGYVPVHKYFYKTNTLSLCDCVRGTLCGLCFPQSENCDNCCGQRGQWEIPHPAWHRLVLWLVYGFFSFEGWCALELVACKYECYMIFRGFFFSNKGYSLQYLFHHICKIIKSIVTFCHCR